MAVEDGRICYAGPTSGLRWECAREVVDGRSRVTMPGLVDAHFHSSYTLLRGAAQDVPEIEWSNRAVAPIRRHLKPADEIVGCRLAVLEGIRAGTTTFAELSPRVAELVESVYLPLGVRVVATETINEVSLDRFHLAPSDPYPFDPARGERSLARAEELFDRFAGHPLVTPMYGPHAVDMMSLELLRTVRERALGRGTRIHLHLAQGGRERLQVAARYGSGVTSVGLLERHGMLGGFLIAAHCHDTSVAERELMARRGVRMVSCQSSIAMIDGIVPPLSHYVDLGGVAALGSDQAVGPGSHSMLREMRTAALLAKTANGDPTRLPAWQVLDLATRGGAAVLGLEDRVGTLEVGKRADLVTVRLDRLHTTPAIAGPPRTVLPNLVYSATASDIDDVVVDGRFLLRAGRFVGVDEEALIREAGRRARSLFRRAEADWRRAGSKAVTDQDAGRL